MRVYSPSEIGYIFLKGLEKDNEMKVLSITEAEARMIYSSISGEFKKKLEDIFGIERLTLNFQDLVKTYEDACEITGSVPDIEYDDRSELARLKLIPNLSTVLQYYFPEFNKDRFAPRCTNYNGFWWDVDDKTSRIEVLSILIDIYERKLNDENLYYIG